MHSVVPSGPSKHDQVQLLSCTSLRRLLEMPKAVLNRQIRSFSTSKVPIRTFWRCRHDQSCGLTPFDPHQECLAPGHTSTLTQPNPTDGYNFGTSASHNRPSHLFSWPQQQKIIHELNLSQPSSNFSCWDHQARLLQTRNETRSQEKFPGSPTVWCVFRQGSWP